MLRTIKDKSEIWDAAKKLLGMDRVVTDDACLEEIYPGTEADKIKLRNGLTKLDYFFRAWNKP
jgi:hypothetical protein